MASIPWIDETFDALRLVSRAANEVNRIGDAMLTLGMEQAAERLFGAAADLCEAERAIRQAVGKECNDSANQAAQATANMMAAVLAVASRRAAVE